MSRLRELKLPGNRLLPARLLSVSYVRSSGPGGQNVNKVATKVDLRLDLPAARPWLDTVELARIRRRLGNRLDAEGRLRITSSEHREQSRNLAAALTRMEALLARALRPPKRRVATKPSRRANERRIESKRRHGRLKSDRSQGGKRGSDW
jgi:ribosome-associated protein